eukprot:1787694-Rhodomonas_salina.2
MPSSEWQERVIVMLPSLESVDRDAAGCGWRCPECPIESWESDAKLFDWRPCPEGMELDTVDREYWRETVPPTVRTCSLVCVRNGENTV